MNEIIELVVITCAAIALTVLLIIAIIVPAENKICSDKWKRANVKSTYSIWTGCMIEHEGNWIPEDRYIVVK